MIRIGGSGAFHRPPSPSGRVSGDPNDPSSRCVGVTRGRASHPLHQHTARRQARMSESSRPIEPTLNLLDVADLSSLPPLHRRYRLVSALGAGAFSRTFLSHDLCYDPPREVVVKVMHPQYEVLGMREMLRLRELRLRDGGDRLPIVDIRNSFYAGNNFCLVFERLYGDLLSRPLSPGARRTSEIAKVTVQLLTALMFLHERGIVHADLKPENVLYSSDRASSRALKLIDFGNSVLMEEMFAYTTDFEMQTLIYRAPEVLAGVSISPSVDMWSVGCLLVELLSGRPLFSHDSRESLLAFMVLHLGPLPFAVYEHGRFVTPDLFQPGVPADAPELAALRLSFLELVMATSDHALVRFVDELLAYDPARRPTPRQALMHPFMRALTPLPHIMAPADAAEAAYRRAPVQAEVKLVSPVRAVKVEKQVQASVAEAVKVEEEAGKKRVKEGEAGGVIRLTAKRAAVSKLVFTPKPEELETYDVIMLVGNETFGNAPAAPPPVASSPPPTPTKAAPRGRSPPLQPLLDSPRKPPPFSPQKSKRQPRSSPRSSPRKPSPRKQTTPTRRGAEVQQPAQEEEEEEDELLRENAVAGDDIEGGSEPWDELMLL